MKGRCRITIECDKIITRENEEGAFIGCHWIEHPHTMEIVRTRFTGWVVGEVIMHYDGEKIPKTAELVTTDGRTIPLELTGFEGGIQ